MTLKDLMVQLQEFRPFLYCGAGMTEVSFLVEAFSSLPPSAAVYVADNVCVRSPQCEVLFTSNELLGNVPFGIPNVVLVDMRALPHVRKKLAQFLRCV